MRLDAYKEQKEEEAKTREYSAWLNGVYVLRAIGAALGGKKNKYPDSPLKEEEIVVEDMEVPEDKVEEYRMMWFSRLQSMADKHKKPKQQGE